MEWICDKQKELNIAMALCVGDLSQDGTSREFLRADQAFSVLDEAKIPYLVTDGNHDGPDFKNTSAEAGMRPARDIRERDLPEFPVISLLRQVLMNICFCPCPGMKRMWSWTEPGR